MRIAIVTGATSGLGKEFALQIPKLYKQLDEIWLIARRTDRMEKLKKDISIPVRIFDGDLQRDYIYDRIAKELDRQAANIRMLVNCAGFGKIGDVADIDAKEQLEMIELNCKALTRLTLFCLPYMNEGARIIQVASAAAFAPQPGFSVYAATKSFVYSFSRGLGAELKDKGIVVTTVCPGPVNTEFFDIAGKYGNAEKFNLLAEAAEVVKQALADAVHKKEVSVYGKEMKWARAAAKLFPARMVMEFMRKWNKK